MGGGGGEHIKSSNIKLLAPEINLSVINISKLHRYNSGQSDKPDNLVFYTYSFLKFLKTFFIIILSQETTFNDLKWAKYEDNYPDSVEASHKAFTLLDSFLKRENQSQVMFTKPSCLLQKCHYPHS